MSNGAFTPQSSDSSKSDSSYLSNPLLGGPLSPNRVEEILNRFRFWLLDFANEVELQSELKKSTADSSDVASQSKVDLHLLLANMVSLRQENHLQTKTNRSLIEQNSEVIKQFQELNQITKLAVQPPTTQINDQLKPMIKGVIDAFDALALGQNQIQKFSDKIEPILNGISEEFTPDLKSPLENFQVIPKIKFPDHPKKITYPILQVVENEGDQATVFLPEERSSFWQRWFGKKAKPSKMKSLEPADVIPPVFAESKVIEAGGENSESLNSISGSSERLFGENGSSGGVSSESLIASIPVNRPDSEVWTRFIALVREFDSSWEEWGKEVEQKIQAWQEGMEAKMASHLQTAITKMEAFQEDFTDRADDHRERLEQMLDHLQRAIDGLATGYSMSLQRLERVFQQFEIQPIPTVGEKFDPEKMEVLEVATNSGYSAGTVVEEVRRGYLWRGLILRYAQVRVAR